MPSSSFAERFNQIIRGGLRKLAFQRGTGTWIDGGNAVTKQYKNTKHLSKNLAPVEAS